MAVVVISRDHISGQTVFTALSTDTLPHCAAGSIAYITDVKGRVDEYDGQSWVQISTSGAAHAIDALSVPGTLVCPKIGGLDAPDVRFTYGATSTPFSHARVYVNAATIGAAGVALNANTSTEIALPGVNTIYTGGLIYSLAAVGVYMDGVAGGAAIADGAGTRELGCIPDDLAYDNAAVVESKTAFWEWASGVDLVVLTIAKLELNDPLFRVCRAMGYTL